MRVVDFQRPAGWAACQAHDPQQCHSRSQSQPTDYGSSSRAFAAWRERRPYDRSGPEAAWRALVSGVTGRGATVRRARIVSKPASDYIRFEHEANLAAGEQVRWLPR